MSYLRRDLALIRKLAALLTLSPCAACNLRAHTAIAHTHFRRHFALDGRGACCWRRVHDGGGARGLIAYHQQQLAQGRRASPADYGLALLPSRPPSPFRSSHTHFLRPSSSLPPFLLSLFNARALLLIHHILLSRLTLHAVSPSRSLHRTGN